MRASASIYVLLLLASVLLATPTARAQDAPAETLLSVQGMRADISWLAAKLEALHPVPYRWVQADTVAARARRAQASITEPMTSRAFYAHIAPFVGVLNDGHTRLSYPSDVLSEYEDNEGRFFPIQVHVDGDRLFVRKDLTDWPVVAEGQEIKAIQGLSAPTILKRLRTFSSAASPRYGDRLLENRFSEWFYLAYGAGEPFYAQIDDTTYRYDGVSLNTVKRSRMFKEAFTYERVSTQTGVLTMNTFSLTPGKFERQLDDVFNTIERDQISHLIVDVRRNRGGYVSNVETLVDRLARDPYRTFDRVEVKRSDERDAEITAWVRNNPMKIFVPYFRTPKGMIHVERRPSRKPQRRRAHFSGTLTVLTGSETYSSGVVFAAVVKDYRLGSIIGEETGGQANTFGDYARLTLPNSGLPVRVSTAYYVRPNGDESPGGVQPDLFTPEAQALEKALALSETP